MHHSLARPSRKGKGTASLSGHTWKSPQNATCRMTSANSRSLMGPPTAATQDLWTDSGLTPSRLNSHHTSPPTRRARRSPACWNSRQQQRPVPPRHSRTVPYVILNNAVLGGSGPAAPPCPRCHIQTWLTARSAGTRVIKTEYCVVSRAGHCFTECNAALPFNSEP